MGLEGTGGPGEGHEVWDQKARGEGGGGGGGQAEWKAGTNKEARELGFTGEQTRVHETTNQQQEGVRTENI